MSETQTESRMQMFTKISMASRRGIYTSCRGNYTFVSEITESSPKMTINMAAAVDLSEWGTSLQSSAIADSCQASPRQSS